MYFHELPCIICAFSLYSFISLISGSTILSLKTSAIYFCIIISDTLKDKNGILLTYYKCQGDAHKGFVTKIQGVKMETGGLMQCLVCGKMIARKQS